LALEKYIVHLARLGAESFIFDASRLEGDRYYRWVDYPEINQGAENLKLRENFLHFAMRRLHQTGERHAAREAWRQMDRAAALWLRCSAFFQSELAREYRLGIPETLLLEYRTLLAHSSIKMRIRLAIHKKTRRRTGRVRV
jgi:hypothetical protein